VGSRTTGRRLGGLSLLRQASVAHCAINCARTMSATLNEDLKISLLREDGVQTGSTKV
jgi:hypothetical protein